MKFKLFIGVIMFVAAAGSWWLFHAPKDRPQKSQKANVAAEAAPASTAVPPSPVHLHPLKAVTQISSNPELSIGHGNNWSVIEIIVDDQAPYQKRLPAMDQLGPMSENDWEQLKKYLLTPNSQDQIQQNQILKNRLLDVLCAMNPPPSELGDVLIQMYQDQKQVEVLRDYAVQHMSAYYEQVSQTINAAAIQDVLWQATSETSDTIGGTALLALQRLSDEYPNFDKNKIASTALQMAQNLASTEPAQITSYQVCAQLNVPKALPVVLAAAQGGQTVPIKMSAIAALGQMGGPEQKLFLNSILAGSEERLKPAAQASLDKITSRNQLAN